MEITFLGTSSMVPTKERNHSAIYVKYKNNGILVDCGEGTQRQMTKTGIAPLHVNKILITHWHGDHVLGLPGLLQTRRSDSAEPVRTLEIYGPPAGETFEGIKKKFERMQQTFDFELGEHVKIIEVQEGTVFQDQHFRIETAELYHTVPSYGYSIVESDRRRIDLAAARKAGIPEGPLLGRIQSGKPVKVEGRTIKPADVSSAVPGKKLTVIGDTAEGKACSDLASGADLLICESTYANDLREKADLYKHLTAGQAGHIASSSGAKKLIITHFSRRYKNTQDVEEDAREVFNNVIAAEDFMKVLL